MTSVSESDLKGSVFAGRYRIKKLLGEGDRKRTYLAEDIVCERPVALSLVKAPAAASDPEGTRREVRILARAGTNENVVTIHDAGTSDGDLYSLGAVLWEAMTGAQPERPRQGSMTRALAEARPDLPSSLRATVCSLLAESPEERPASAGQVLAAFLLPRQGPTGADRSETWAASLPFPLASILWQYYGETDEGAKVALLLKFFEALGQFAATVLLSACLTDREVFDAHRSDWFGDGPERLKLEYAGFGAWVELAGRLTEYLSALPEDDDGAERIRRLFHTRDLALADALSSQNFAKILLCARDRRNTWAGHGGIAGEEVQRARLSEIRDLLAKTQAALDSAFEPWTLIKPGQMTFDGKTFDLTATMLKGPNSAFRKQYVKLTEPLDTNRLYLLHDGESRALGLAPLIRVLTGTKGRPACYFYSRMEGPKAHWVSYHHQEEPELQCPDSELSDLLAMVSGAPPRDLGREMTPRNRHSGHTPGHLAT